MTSQVLKRGRATFDEYLKNRVTDDEMLEEVLLRMRGHDVIKYYNNLERLYIVSFENVDKLQDEDWQVKLHLACKRLDVEGLDKLLKKNVDVNVRDSQNGDTPLHITAKTNGCSIYTFMLNFNVIQIAKRLLSNGADVNIRNQHGQTPLYCAAEALNVPMVKSLLLNKADPNMKNGDGDSALHAVIKRAASLKTRFEESKEIVRLLLENGANVHEEDGNGWTALHFVVNTDDVMLSTIFTELLIWGASLFTLDENRVRLLDKLIFPEAFYELKFHPKLKKVLVEYIIALQCAKLDCNEYAIVESTLSFKDFFSPVLASYKLKQMKRMSSGSHVLSDVFNKYRDPKFVCDKSFEDYVKNLDSNRYFCREASYPLEFLDYGSLLKAKFASAQKRYKMMMETHGKITNKLPNEVVWKILTFLTDKDLELVVKAVRGFTSVCQYVSVIKSTVRLSH